MERIQYGDYEYIREIEDSAEIIFFTSKGNLNFNIRSSEGLNNIEMLKAKFGLSDIGYLEQIHSNFIFDYDGQMHQGDAIITDKKNVGLGVFTADCVPILIHDRIRNVIGAVHSGWKGTYTEITSFTIRRMCEEYGTKPSDLNVYIGPHNRQCCYEIGREVADKFLEKEIYSGISIIKDNKLSMEKCIERQCLSSGVLQQNIKLTDICTYCSQEYELYSYRRNKEQDGRLFSLIFIKN